MKQSFTVYRDRCEVAQSEGLFSATELQSMDDLQALDLNAVGVQWHRIVAIIKNVFKQMFPDLNQEVSNLQKLFFSYFWATETSCKHTNDMLSSFEFINKQTAAYSVTQINISIYLKLCF